LKKTIISVFQIVFLRMATLSPSSIFLFMSLRSTRIAIAIFFFISGFGFTTWASRIPDIQHKLQLNNAQLGTVLFAMPIGLILTLPVTGILLQRYSSRLILFAGTIAFNAMLACLGFVTHAWQLAIVLFLFGSSRNLMNISVNAQSVGIQALYNRSIITTFHGIWSIAGSAGAGLGLLLVALKVLPDWHFLCVGLALIITAIFAHPGTLNEPPSPQASGKKFILPDKHMFKFGLISFASMACEGTMYDWSGIYFEKAVHAPHHLIIAGYVAYMIAMSTGRFGGDKLVPRLGVKKMLLYSGILILAGFSTAALLPTMITAGLGFIMVGFGVACIIPLVFSIAGKSKTMGNGPAIAAVSTVGYVGFLMVPPVVGYLAQAAGLRWTFACIALLGLLIITLILQSKSLAED
jgi:MFS family permease